MSDQHKAALQKIVVLCEHANELTNRLERIYDIALEGLGMPPKERAAEIAGVRERTHRAVAARRALLAQKLEATCNE